MKKGDFIIYDPVGMLKKIAEETKKAKKVARSRNHKRKAAQNVRYRSKFPNQRRRNRRSV